MCDQITELGLRSVRVFCSDGCEPRAEITPARARLLLALDRAGGFLPKREATRASLAHPGRVLTPSDRSSAARSITRLERTGLVKRIDADVWLTPRATTLLAWARDRVEAAASGRTIGRL